MKGKLRSGSVNEGESIKIMDENPMPLVGIRKTRGEMGEDALERVRIAANRLYGFADPKDQDPLERIARSITLFQRSLHNFEKTGMGYEKVRDRVCRSFEKISSQAN